MEIRTQNYLNFSDEILENLLDMQYMVNKGTGVLSHASLMLVDNVIDEYCLLIQEIQKEKEPEYIELGNLALDILKTGMYIKTALESNVNETLNVA